MKCIVLSRPLYMEITMPDVREPEGGSALKMQAQLNMSRVDEVRHARRSLQPIVTCNSKWVRQVPMTYFGRGQGDHRRAATSEAAII